MLKPLIFILGVYMNYRFFILLAVPMFSYGFDPLNLKRMKQMFDKKAENLKATSTDKKQCECYESTLEKGFSLKEINAFFELSPQEQEKMLDIVMMTVQNKCQGKKILNRLTKEDRQVLKKFEDCLWGKKASSATTTEEIKHAVTLDILEEKDALL